MAKYIAFDQLLAASERLKTVVYKTPVMQSGTLNQCIGANVFLKCENFQRVGAFKFRGAYNAISQLSDADKAKGVLAYSSGNHAQAVALVGRLLGIKTIIAMPSNAPKIKLAATRAYGANVIEFDPLKLSREDVAAKILKDQALVLIPPFDHEDIICGQGTAALELHQEIGGLDYLLVPCGGGGLLSGSALATKGIRPQCQVIGIEPEMADDATRSYRTKILQRNPNPPTIADGTRTTSLGQLTFPLILENVDDMRTVSEAAIMHAVRWLFFRMKLVVEPSGALGIAALLSGAVSVSGKVGVVISGGNIDADTMRMILASA